MKKKTILVFLFFIIFSITNVYATCDMQTLIENNYDYLNSMFPDYVYEQMSCEKLEAIINENFVLEQSATEYDNGDEYGIMPLTTDTYGTASKEVTITYFAGATNRMITLSAVWSVVPNVRSHDLLGIRSTSVVINPDSFSSYIYYSTPSFSSRTDYDSSYSNVKYTSNAIGTIFTLPTETNLTALKFYMVVFLQSSSGTVYGTYQHARSAISYANANTYVFAGSDLGRVFHFSNSIYSNKYDDMQGVSISY